MAKKVGGFKKILAMAYGLGAAIVILGALFKIMHWEGADLMLIIGMGTEVLIFVFSAFEPTYEDYQWERVYPHLFDESSIEVFKNEDNSYGGGAGGFGGAGGGALGGGNSLMALDNALSKNTFDNDMLDRLGANLEKLSTNIGSMNSVADVASATEGYSEAAKNASVSMVNLQGVFEKSAESAKNLAISTSGTQEYQEQIQLVTKNLTQLNSIYQIELQDANNHIKNLNRFVGNLAEAMSSLESTKSDALNLKDNMNALSKSLSSLNNIYGGMLTAMRTA
jgi:gliding motility-associated protein GldL